MVRQDEGSVRYAILVYLLRCSIAQCKQTWRK